MSEEYGEFPRFYMFLMLPCAYMTIWSPTKRFLGFKTPIGHTPLDGGMWIVDMGLMV